MSKPILVFEGCGRTIFVECQREGCAFWLKKGYSEDGEQGVCGVILKTTRE